MAIFPVALEQANQGKDLGRVDRLCVDLSTRCYHELICVERVV